MIQFLVSIKLSHIDTNFLDSKIFLFLRQKDTQDNLLMSS